TSHGHAIPESSKHRQSHLVRRQMDRIDLERAVDNWERGQTTVVARLISQTPKYFHAAVYSAGLAQLIWQIGFDLYTAAKENRQWAAKKDDIDPNSFVEDFTASSRYTKAIKNEENLLSQDEWLRSNLTLNLRTQYLIEHYDESTPFNLKLVEPIPPKMDNATLMGFVLHDGNGLERREISDRDKVLWISAWITFGPWFSQLKYSWDDRGNAQPFEKLLREGIQTMEDTGRSAVCADMSRSDRFFPDGREPLVEVLVAQTIGYSSYPSVDCFGKRPF
ncbi:hypothetical protein BC829DRAFT_410643, partial [Chytridium lagenaria]